MTIKWAVDLSREAKKKYKTLNKNGLRPSITDAIGALVADLKLNGPALINWPNYRTIHEKKTILLPLRFKKRKTYILACCELINKKENKIEVFYVGSHEGAPYQ